MGVNVVRTETRTLPPHFLGSARVATRQMRITLPADRDVREVAQTEPVAPRARPTCAVRPAPGTRTTVVITAPLTRLERTEKAFEGAGVSSAVRAGATGSGVGSTMDVGAEVALAEPTGFAAVTPTRIVPSWSVEASVYVDEVAPAMLWQFPPPASQRLHWRERVGVG
ncbi:MAG: hypothetical protein ACO3PB_09225 [Miltoncostaeaceae bacterium]